MIRQGMAGAFAPGKGWLSGQVAVGLLLLGVAACESGTANPPVIDGVASVGGVVYLDIDGSESLTGTDEPVEGARVRVTLPASGTEVAADTTDDAGEFLMEEIPVGTVEVELDSVTLGDTLLAVPVDSARFTLGAEQTLGIALGVTYPQLSLAEVRTAAAGIPIFTQGVVLNPRGQAPGGAVHVVGDSVALRVLVPPAVLAAIGDSVRIQGRVGTDLGQPALLDARIFRIVPGARDVDPLTPSMGEAAAAGDHGLDAALVEFTSGSVVSEETVPEGFLLIVTDGTDTLQVRLRTSQGFINGGIPSGAQILRLVGLLVPNAGEDTWSLVPRNTLDVRLGPPPGTSPS